MAQEKKKQQAGKVTLKAAPQAAKKKFPEATRVVTIRYPLLWLALAVLVVYAPTLNFGFTELDDSIFIREFHAYNEDLNNFLAAFTRGLFDATKDPYYRPIFADSMQFNYLLFKQNIAGYHLFNLMIHMGAVMLLYNLFLKLRVKELSAFILTLIFAVHPVLTQAVAWIPGRNDTLLAIFTFSFLISVITYAEKGQLPMLFLSILCLLLAFFTKETAVFAAPVAFILLVFLLGYKWTSQRNIVMYGTWVACFAVWFIARAHATVQPTHMPVVQMLGDLIHRLPLIWQYIGKIFLPYDLSVFPIQQDTPDIPGLIAIAALVTVFYFSKDINWRYVLVGAGVFLLFLLPALLVPSTLNEQSFEHRLYMPIIGILLLLPQTFIFKKATDGSLLRYGIVLCVLLSVISYMHQRNFKDPLSFWTQAAATSPHSAYANMMLAARLDDVSKSEELFRKAYQLNPKEKYLNFYYGKMLQMQDSVLASESHLLYEKKTSGYYECDFYLARVAMMKKDTVGSADYLKSYLKADPASGPANNNLLLIDMSIGKLDDAREQVKHMRSVGMPVPPQILQHLGMK